ncbi:MAG TPA: hybrid sensor histidine kinase/response regulator, partial [Anaerolineae bacterium]|nr:hybrid sensor histidine kinase/response regulator [Anaerolineae bacterium]
DIAKVRAKAIDTGYLSEIEAKNIPDEELRQLIFQPGFSTADEVTDVSGRGVGMDAVRTSVGRLKGTIHLSSQAGEGTRITIRLPLTLAVMRALLVKTHGTEYALPLSSVAQILRLDGDDVTQIGFNPIIHVGNKVLPLVQLGELLGKPPADLSERKRLPVLLIKTGDEQVAMIVDEILEGREVVIKTLGNHLRYVHGVTGATLMGDGRVILILNPPELVNEPTQQQARQWKPPAVGSVTAPKAKILDILVVDDSVSVRKVVANMVKNAGWQPQMARDGLEALEAIQSAATLPDAILLDIEMPRMNGFELTATLRANETYRNIPIVMLTSRAGDKHRSKAFDLGVNDYLVKPYREEDLLAAVQRVTHSEK